MKKFAFMAVAAAAMLFAGCESLDENETPKKTALAAPVLTAGEISAVGFKVEWNAVENAAGYEYSFDGAEAETTAELSVAFGDLEPLTEYSVKVKAVAAENADYENSEYSELTVRTAEGLKYEGVVYKIVTLADGNTWMAENLRYVPEGKTVSADPTENAGIWYPYNPETQTALTDEESIAKNGLFYNIATAFGVESIDKETAAQFEGTQGICPDGWHIPTFDEYLHLVGKSSKLSAAIGGYESGTTPTLTDALYYNTEYDGGKASEMTDWNFIFAGFRNGAGSGSYIKGVGDYVLKPMTYFLGSTYYPTTASNTQFMCLGCTTTATYPEGRITVMFGNHVNGVSVRCVKNK